MRFGAKEVCSEAAPVTDRNREALWEEVEQL